MALYSIGVRDGDNEVRSVPKMGDSMAFYEPSDSLDYESLMTAIHQNFKNLLVEGESIQSFSHSRFSNRLHKVKEKYDTLNNQVAEGNAKVNTLRALGQSLLLLCGAYDKASFVNQSALQELRIAGAALLGPRRYDIKDSAVASTRMPNLAADTTPALVTNYDMDKLPA